MTTITRVAVVAVAYWTALVPYNQWRNRLAIWRDNKLGQLMGWLLSKRSVQNAVVAAFVRGTPMCSFLGERSAQLWITSPHLHPKPFFRHTEVTK